MTRKREVFLIDGSSYFYRAFYAMRNLSTSKGMPTNAVYILARMLLKLIKEKNPEYICFVLDSKAPTERHRMYEAYKATRPSMPESLQVQLPYIFKIVDALGIPILQKEGVEADDIIATAARKFKADSKVTIISGDKDLMQLVDNDVVVWDTLKDKLYDRKGVHEKFSVNPEFMADLLAIMGDSSDNIPGVPGIGPKGAVDLIEKMGHLGEIIDHASKISNARTREALLKNRDLALLSLDLVRLDRDVPLDINERDMRIREMDLQKLSSLFEELEFRALLTELVGEPTRKKTVHEGRIEYACKQALHGEAGMYVMLGKGSAVSQKDITYVCLDNDAYLEPLERKTLRLCMHDAKEAAVAVKTKGIEVKAEIFDTMLAAYCCDAAAGTTAMEDLAGLYLDREVPRSKEFLGTGRGARLPEDLESEEVAHYLASHSECLVPLKGHLIDRMKQLGVDRIFYEIETPLLDVLATMEAAGVLVDPDVLLEISKEISIQVLSMEEQIYRLAGRTFNINSPKQLGEVLFQDLNLPMVKKTKTGYSTNSDVLETLASKHELPAIILDWRMLTKLKNTYVDSLPVMCDPKTHRIHTRFNQAITATGRISSSEPNLQNIPIRSEMGRRIRGAFKAPKGFKIVSADYSQIELRILAHITKDASLIESFENGIDIHTRTAAEIFGIPLKDVTENHRRQAKTINFGIIYGMGPHKLSGELGIRREVAKQYIDNYLSKYPKVKEYMENIAQAAARDGYVTTIMGRRRSIPEIRSDNFNEREAARRIAINTPIQGSAADIIKMAMVRIHEHLKGLKSRMILQVHDELVFEVSDAELNSVKDMVRTEMEHAYPLMVPVHVDVGFGENWAKAH
jgi:DNA polymerase-1